MRKKKNLGQHFLNNPHILEFEVNEAGVEDASVLEIGAGDGRLTEIISEKAEKVTAIEKDPELADFLKEKFNGTNVEIIESDFLEFPPGKFEVIMGNIPYYISSPILFKLNEFEFDRAVLCVQKEFAERMAASAGERHYSRLTVMSNIYFEIHVLKIVPASHFTPRPKVDSAIVFLRKTGRTCDEFTSDFINAIFQHKKKTLKNSLLSSSSSFALEKTEMRKIAQNIKSSEKRVFKLNIGEILEISKDFRKLVEK